MDPAAIPLADIELPPLPPEPSYLSLTTFLAAVTLIGAATLFVRQRYQRRKNPSASADNPAGDLLAQLHEIHRGWQTGRFDERECAYRLANLLRIAADGINLPAGPAMRELHDVLTALRYRRTPDVQLRPHHFDVIRHTLTSALSSAVEDHER